MYSVKNLSLTVAGAELLQDVTAEFRPGEVVGLLGHNGSGKSTMLKLLARQMAATAGSIKFDGRKIEEFDTRAFSRNVAYMAQDNGDAGLMKAQELVACGRYPWHGALGTFGADDRQKVEEALKATQVEKLADRFVSSLSGGERQRVWLAMMVAQDTRFLLLDEPISALDAAHQIEVLSLIRSLAHDRGLGVIAVLHDLNLAIRFCDRILALKSGRLIADDAPEQFAVESKLSEVYGLRMGVTQHPALPIPLTYVY